MQSRQPHFLGRALRRSHLLIGFGIGSLLLALTPMLGVESSAAADRGHDPRSTLAPFDQQPATKSPHHGIVPANAMEPAAPTLDRTGWTAAASDEETGSENGRAANVLDGDSGTIWHSKWSGTPAPLPHSITIDMHRTAVVSALVYLPRSNGGNGRIGEYSISVSADGQSWASPVATGTLADDAGAKTLGFAPQGMRFVRLTALTEAGGRGPWTSAAEINLLGDPGTPAATVDLPRTGWTAAASDEETSGENGRAANVLDGNGNTIWHSKWSGAAPAPFPHSITIDMHRTAVVSALAYQPRPDGANGRVGAYTITTSTDGATFGAPVSAGAWRDDDTVKTATFTRAENTRFIRLTVTGEAGARGPWTSAAEIRLSGPASPAVHGSWDRITGFPLVPVATAVLPGDKLLAWSAYAVDRFGGSNGYTQTAVLDLKTGKVTQRRIDNTGHDMFCPGIAMLADGRVLVTGGSNAEKASIYDPATDDWSATTSMNIARGYQAMTLLSTGEAFVLGGSWSGTAGDKAGEVWSPDTRTWRTLPGVPAAPAQTADPAGPYRADNHMWLHATSGGKVLQLGPSKQMNWISTSGSGSITSAGPRADSGDAMTGNAVAYDIGKLLTLGGSPAYQNTPATQRAYTVTVDGDQVRAARTGDMGYARGFGNSVVMPDGKVAVFGGQALPVPFSDATSVLTPELWDPATGGFTPLATMAIPRNYHSVANLLPDGRIFSGGGGLCGDCATNHPDGAVFTPPYLLNADGSPKPRPLITAGVPPRTAPGTSLTVSTQGPVASFVLMRAAAATHSTDNDQRRIPLVSAATGTGTYAVSVPADPGVVLPGTYMLFALDAQGVPSIAKFVTVS
ncbi:discoidin domain-containing protein [Streptomyces sp. NBC_00503]|uniref:discoidin domain-containing protein n=1 Tax=Streptomyces sp. NBC_00503 TaxID=2903659 RepID=UPI002E81FF67|nr:discoidin domain-containing protein [Streptomyces sp. NBC_00503]WUD79348.1 discoidin domain-containing protein [Streptomyces sp. NBC_00503]